MKHLFLLLFVQPIICNAQNDTITFIGMLGYERVKKIVDPHREGAPEYDFFMDNFDVTCRWVDENIKDLPINARVAPKETYHDKYFQGKQVEIRIEVPARAFYGSHYRDVQLKAYSKKLNKYKSQRIPAFTISTQLIYPKDNKINSNTYKIEKIIGISSPEEISIPMVIDYIDKRLYGDSVHSSNFLSTIVDLDRFYEKRSLESSLQYEQLIRFYDLLHFIEPFVSENSFLNEEARKLNFKLNQIADTLHYMNFDQELYNDLMEEYNFGKNVYQDYQKFFTKLNGYYIQLQGILFLRTPSQVEWYKNNRLAPIVIDTTELSNLKITIGIGATYGLNKIYNITTTQISDSNRVQFQDVSRLNSTISAGLIWSPFYKKNTRDSSRTANNMTTKYYKSNFSLGFFLDYYLFPSQKEVNSISKFGLGLGIGYSKNNFGILGKISFNTLRYPRQFFIDSFRNQNRPLGSFSSGVNINDNSLFFDKTNISLGVTVVYIFTNYGRKR